MKYLYYKNIKKIPLNIKQQIENNISPIDDILNDLCSGYDTENYLFMILMDRKKLVGLLGIVYISSKMKKMMNLNFREKTYEIRDVFILPEYRGKGLCKKMIEEIKSHVIKYDIARRLKLHVLENNLSAFKCYISAGFKIYKNKLAKKWLNNNFEKYFGFKPKEEQYILTVKL